MAKMPDDLRTAAAAMTGDAPAAGRAGDLLRELEYDDGVFELVHHRQAMLCAAAGFRRIFRIAAPDAPALVVFGAEVEPRVVGFAATSPIGVSGAGLSFRQAFEACVGEGVEHLSQYADDCDVFEDHPPAQALAGATPALQALWRQLAPRRLDPAADRIAWSIATSLADGSPVLLPADICFRRPVGAREIDVPWLLGNGCAAGVDHLSATIHGLLELIERDAVTLWWRGGAPPRVLRGEVSEALLWRLRGSAPGRLSWFLDITSDTGVPTVVAASCDGSGYGLCCGYAARPTLAMAADAAARELAQMELAHRLSAAKRDSRGARSLNVVDISHIRRFTEIPVERTPALHPRAPPRPPSDLPVTEGPALLAALRHRLALLGFAPCAIDLTRDTFSIPVVRTICPGLELGLAAPPGERLLAVASRHGCDPAAEVLL